MPNTDATPTPQQGPTLDELDTLITLPQEFATAGVEVVRNAGKNGSKSISLNIPLIKDYISPLRPGTLMGIIGQTSHGKSLLMHYLEYRAALQLLHEKRKQFIVHVSVEEPIEDMALLALARHSNEPLNELMNGVMHDKDGVMAAAFRIADTPIVYIGESIDATRSLQKKSLYDHMSISNITMLIFRIAKMLNMTPALMCWDYLQALPIDRSLLSNPGDAQRRLQVRNDVFELRKLSLVAPNVVNIQAKQELRGVRYDRLTPMPQIPGVYDGEETSAIGQRFDRLLGVWMPARSYPVGTKVQIGPMPEDTFTVQYNQMYVKAVKQRGNLPAGRVWACDLNFDTGDINPEASYG